VQRVSERAHRAIPDGRGERTLSDLWPDRDVPCSRASCAIVPVWRAWAPVSGSAASARAPFTAIWREPAGAGDADASFHFPASQSGEQSASAPRGFLFRRAIRRRAPGGYRTTCTTCTSALAAWPGPNAAGRKSAVKSRLSSNSSQRADFGAAPKEGRRAAPPFGGTAAAGSALG
jgi:hypothetical protein